MSSAYKTSHSPQHSSSCSYTATMPSEQAQQYPQQHVQHQQSPSRPGCQSFPSMHVQSQESLAFQHTMRAQLQSPPGFFHSHGDQNQATPFIKKPLKHAVAPTSYSMVSPVTNSAFMTPKNNTGSSGASLFAPQGSGSINALNMQMSAMGLNERACAGGLVMASGSHEVTPTSVTNSSGCAGDGYCGGLSNFCSTNFRGGYNQSAPFVYQPIQVTHQQAPLKGEPEACLFVASLNAQKTDEQLTASVTSHFAAWGQLLNVKVMKDWMNRPYAFVQFSTVENARRALEESHDTIVDGRHIRVEQARVNRTLFIARLPKTMTEAALQAHFEKWGRVECVTLLLHSNTGRSKGCAFVKFRYREDAIRAYLHIRQLGKWAIEWASNIEKNQTERDRHSIFVTNLNPALVTQELLEERFSLHGQLEEAKLINKSGEAFAFIRYEEEDCAQAAVEKENGANFLDAWIQVQLRESSCAVRQMRMNPPNYYAPVIGPTASACGIYSQRFTGHQEQPQQHYHQQQNQVVHRPLQKYPTIPKPYEFGLTTQQHVNGSSCENLEYSQKLLDYNQGKLPQYSNSYGGGPIGRLPQNASLPMSYARQSVWNPMVNVSKIGAAQPQAIPASPRANEALLRCLQPVPGHEITYSMDTGLEYLNQKNDIVPNGHYGTSVHPDGLHVSPNTFVCASRFDRCYAPAEMPPPTQSSIRLSRSVGAETSFKHYPGNQAALGQEARLEPPDPSRSQVQYYNPTEFLASTRKNTLQSQLVSFQMQHEEPKYQAQHDQVGTQNHEHELGCEKDREATPQAPQKKEHDDTQKLCEHQKQRPSEVGLAVEPDLHSDPGMDGSNLSIFPSSFASSTCATCTIEE